MYVTRPSQGQASEVLDLVVTLHKYASCVHNHVKLGVFSKGTALCGGCAMGLADLWGIADLHCRKVESTKWLKHKLCHVRRPIL